MANPKRQARKKTREIKRATKAANKQARKDNRRANNPLSVVRKAVEGRTNRKNKESDAAIEIQKMEAQARINSDMKTAEEERSRVIEMERAEEEAANTGINGGNLPLKAIVKGTNYVKRFRRTPETDPELLAAQVWETRDQQIKKRNLKQIAEERAMNTSERGELSEDAPQTDDVPDYDIEDSLPDYEDTHEDIFEEEEEQFSFDGNEDNFLDPETLGVLANVGKSAADKYRENQFAKGKKAFGQTKAQWEAKKKKEEEIAAGKIPDPSIINAGKKAIEDTIKEQKKQEYTPHIIIGVVLLGLALYVAYKTNPNK